MFHRFSTWWRALSVVLLSLATVTWPSAAGAQTTSGFEFLHQDAVATLSHSGVAHFSTTLRFPAGSQPRAVVTLFPRIIERSQLTPIIAGQGAGGRPITSTGPIDFSCHTATVVQFDVDIYTRKARPNVHHCTTGTPRLHLGCPNARCDGVYPLRYVVTIGQTTRTVWSLLTVQATSVASPLRVNLVETLSTTSIDHPKRTQSNLTALARLGSSPVALALDYRLLNKVIDASADTAYRSALNAALASPLHRAVNAPPGFIDFGGLAAHQLQSEVHYQLSFTHDLLATLTGRPLDGQVVIEGRPSLASLRALNAAGVTQVVLPEGDLATAPSSTLTWGAPFRVTGTTSMLSLIHISEPTRPY